MKRIGTCLAVISAATMSVAPASADKPDKPAKPDKPSNAKAVAAQQCNELKKADKAAFKSLYGPKQAMRNCKKSQTNASEGEFKNAAKECKAERAEDKDAFNAKYGTEKSKYRNALGKCVSQTVKAGNATA